MTQTRHPPCQSAWVAHRMTQLGHRLCGRAPARHPGWCQGDCALYDLVIAWAGHPRMQPGCRLRGGPLARCSGRFSCDPAFRSMTPAQVGAPVRQLSHGWGVHALNDLAIAPGNPLCLSWAAKPEPSLQAGLQSLSPSRLAPGAIRKFHQETLLA